MQGKIQLGQINFINCLPVNYPLALEQKPRFDFEIFEAVPADLNSKLRKSELDLAPISSFEYLQNQDQYQILEGISISSKVEADSVLFFAQDDDLTSQEKIYITDKSATSVNLLKIILKHKYGLSNPSFEVFSGDHSQLPNKLLIGDEALQENLKHEYLFDLGKEWFDLHSLPMVFGLWTINKNSKAFALHKEISEYICKLRDLGLNELFPDIIIEAYKKTGVPKKTLSRYFNNLDYNFDDKHAKSLELFERCLKEI